MLSKDDYREYLKEMLNIENVMFLSYEKSREMVEDNDLRVLFGRLAQDEHSHKEIVGLLTKSIISNGLSL